MVNNLQEIFKTKFDLPKNGFMEPVNLIDAEVGFSVYKIRKQEGFKSLFRVYIKNENLKSNGNIKPITISASYGKEDKDGIVISSTGFKRKLNWPVELKSEDDFFWDIKTYDFLDKKGETVSGIYILNEIDKLHTKSTKTISGFRIRTKIWYFQMLTPFLIKIIFDFISSLQYLISGKKIHIFSGIREPENQTGFSHDPMSIKRGQKIKIFEYEVEAWIAVLYCIAHLLFYSVFYLLNYWPSYLIIIFKNNFLTLTYGIVSLGIANAILPKLLGQNNLLISLLEIIQKLYFKSASKKIKI
jgi:hypothetical protein